LDFQINGYANNYYIFSGILFLSAKNAVRLLKKLSGPHFTPTDRNEPLIHFEYILRHTIPAKRKIIEFKEEQFHSFRGKILFLIGEYDPIANTSSMLRFLEHQTLQYKVISHGGHTMNSECAEVINNEIIGFLEKRTFLNIQDA